MKKNKRKRSKRKQTKRKSPLEIEWARIVAEPRFKGWLTNLSHANPRTAKDMQRKFHVIFEIFRKSPQALTAMSEEEAQAFLIEFVDVMAKKGLKGQKFRNPKTGKVEQERKPLRHNTMVAYVNAVRTWLQHVNRRILLGKIAIPDTEGVYDGEALPERDYVRKLFTEADKRGKVAISIVAFSGGRIEPLGDQTGTDGLEIRDFPEMQVAGGKVTFTKIPTTVIIRRSLAKRTHRESDRLKYGYMTFLNAEGTDHLRDLLEWRIKKGEILTPKSPIISAEKRTGQKQIGSHITTGHAGDIIKDVVVKAGFANRPYLLRRFFASALQDAEEDGLSIRDFRVFWMGHSGTVEEDYTQNKGRLPPSKVEKQREAYKRASDMYLTTRQPTLVPADKIRAEVVRVFFKGAHLKDEAVREVEEKYGGLEKVPDDDLPKIVDEYHRKGYGTYASTSGKQIIVPTTDARRYLNEGYTYVATLPNTNEIVLQHAG